jgi:CheY-like chemotaxis protein
METKNTKILVIDDNKTIHELICRILGKKEYSIDYAKNGRDALEILRGEDFDIIFLDIIMPKMSGLEFMPKLKRLKLKMPTVIAITGFTTLECEKEIIHAGAVTCLHKPFDKDDIIKWVELYGP